MKGCGGKEWSCVRQRGARTKANVVALLSGTALLLSEASFSPSTVLGLVLLSSSASSPFSPLANRLAARPLAGCALVCSGVFVLLC